MKTLLRTIFFLATTMLIVSCGGGLTGQSIGSEDSSEIPDLVEYSRVPKGTCATDFANSEGSGVGEVVAPEIYFDSLGRRMYAAFRNETFSFRSPDGRLARNGPFATWVFEQAIKQAKQSAPERFDTIDLGGLIINWQDYEAYEATLCDAYEGRSSLRPFAINLDVLFGNDDRLSHASKWSAFEYVETGPNVIPAPSPAGLEYYTKYITGGGVIIVGGSNIDDEAFLAAREAVIYMTSARPKFREILKANRARISLFGSSETASVLPEYPDSNEPGGFAMKITDVSMAANAGWQCYPGNMQGGGNPVIHEMAHTINHIVFEEINEVYFYERVYGLAKDAIDTGIFPPFQQNLENGQQQDISHRVGEYWAMVVEGYIMDREGFKNSHDTRDWIIDHDPRVHELLIQYFPTEPWGYCRDVAVENNAPVAVDDTGLLDNGGSIDIDLISNDVDADGDSLDVDVFTQGANGTVTIRVSQDPVQNWGVYYTHDGSDTTSDTFTYTVMDGNGGTDTGTVTVTIRAHEPHDEDREDRGLLESPQITCPDGSNILRPTPNDLLVLRDSKDAGESEARFFPPVIFGDESTMLVVSEPFVYPLVRDEDRSYYQHLDQQIRVYDDGTHGDDAASDGLWSAECLTKSDIGIEYDQFDGFAGSLRVGGYETVLHVIHPAVRGSIDHTDFGNGLLGTEHALFFALGGPGYNKVRIGDVPTLVSPETCEGCAAVLEEFGDVFDHIIVTPDVPIHGASYTRVSDNIEGILTYGDPRCGTGMWGGGWNNPTDFSYGDVEFGCPGKFLNSGDYPRLKGVIWAPDPELGGLNHEFGHWMGYGPSEADFPGSGVSWNSEDRMHIDSNSTVESPMSGPFWDPQRGWPNQVRVLDGDTYKPAQIRSNGDGTFTMVPRSSDQEVFDDIILYMMGFLPEDQAQERYHFLVDSEIHLNDCDSYPGFLDCNDATIDETEYGTVVEFGVNEMISQFGPRVPSYADAPKDLNAAAIVLTKDPASEAQRAWYDLLYEWWSTENSYDEDDFGATWPFATRGLSTITTGIPPINTSPVAPTAAVNNAPVAVDDNKDLLEIDPEANWVSTSISVLDNDTDLDGDSLTITSVTQGLYGSVGIDADGTRVYWDIDIDGTLPPLDTFTYEISDGNGGTATGTVRVTYAPPVNAVPEAIDDVAIVDNGNAVLITVLVNDSDADEETLTIVSATQGANGTTETTQGGVIYTHNGSDTTTDSFDYTVSDSNGGATTATVVVTILDNHHPIAADDAFSVRRGGYASYSARDNDTDPDGDSLIIIATSQPASGRSSIPISGNFGFIVNEEGQSTAGTGVSYSHDGSDNESDVFTYTVSDGKGGTSTATVTVTILPANNPPAIVDDTGTVANGERVEIDVLLNDSDPDGDHLTTRTITQGVNGRVEPSTGVNSWLPTSGNETKLAYIHNGSATTSDTFTYTVTDGNGGTTTGTVTISISAPEDAVPVTGNDSGDVANGGTVEIEVLSNDSDADGDSLTIGFVTQGANGTTEISAGGVTYTHDGSATTSDTFTYAVNDDNGGTATGTVTVTIGTATNNAPVAIDDAITLVRGGVGAYDNIVNNDTDADGDLLTVTAVTQGTHGTVDNLSWGVRYTHDGSATTSDTFTYTVSDDNGGTATGTVTVTIEPLANNVPEAVDDSGDVANAGTVEIDVASNDSDADGDTLTLDSVTQGTNGTVAISQVGVTYTHDGSDTTSDTFTYTVSDGNDGTATGTVTIAVTG